MSESQESFPLARALLRRHRRHHHTPRVTPTRAGTTADVVTGRSSSLASRVLVRAYAAAWNLRTVMTGSLPLTRAYRKPEPMLACPSTSHPARGRYQPHPNERRPTRGVATPSCAGCICSTATSKSSTTDRACPRGLCWPVTTWQSWQHGVTPARAGPTRTRCTGSAPRQGHPRSHGLSRTSATRIDTSVESPPLARALPDHRCRVCAGVRVTPSRAGIASRSGR